MLRKAAVVTAASAVLLAANFAMAQGAAPNAPMPNNMPAAGAAGAGAGGANAAERQLAEFTGTVKEWNATDKIVVMDNGDKYFVRGNDPVAGLDLVKPGTRLTFHYFIDPNEQNEKIIRSIAVPTEGAPRAN